MAVSAANLISAKYAEASEVVQYTASGVTAIIDKFTGTNVGSTAVTCEVYLVSAASSAQGANHIVKTRTVQPGQTYLFPELVGHVLIAGAKIVTDCTASSTLVIRASGRVVS